MRRDVERIEDENQEEREIRERFEPSKRTVRKLSEAASQSERAKGRE